MQLWGEASMPGSLSPVPAEISRRQFFQVLANKGMITQAEALIAVTTGALPGAIEAIIERIDDDDIEWSVRMSFAAQTFTRSNWCVNLFAAMQNMSPDDTDQLWRDGKQCD